MKPELRRIEAALQEAASHYQEHLVDDTTIAAGSPIAVPEPPTGSPPMPLVTLADRPAYTSGTPLPVATAIALPKLELGPNLPEFAATSELQHHFVAFTNSALAINLLKDLQTQVGDWLGQLETTLQQIQSLYQEGPIVDGWLESFHPDIPSHPNYRLCGLDQDGHLWQRPCPPEQVPDIGLAIVRYQRLQTLLRQKQRLETRLGRLTEALVDLHGRLDETME